MVDQPRDDGAGGEDPPPERSDAALGAVPPPGATTELPGAAYPPPDHPPASLPPSPVDLPGRPEPWAAPNPAPSGGPAVGPPTSAGALPGRSPFAEPWAAPSAAAAPSAWAPPAAGGPGGAAAGPAGAAPPLGAPDPSTPYRSPVGSVPTGWAPPSADDPPAHPPAPSAPSPPQAGPGAPPGAVPGWTAPAAPADGPLAPPAAWWARDPGPGPRPPEYDARRWGPLGESGGFPAPAPAADDGRERRRRGAPGSAILIGVVSAIVASLITGGLFLAVADRNGGIGGGRGPSPTLVAPLDIYGLLEKAQPSVVSIRTDFASTTGTTPFAAGSGVIISDDGLVLTNAHVIAGSSSISVTLYDGHEKSASLVGSFPADDIALIRIDDPGTVVAAELGSSDDIAVGDPVVAIGNALNLGGPPSVTEGIVSAKDRNIQTAEATLTNLIQTDAAINEGNSGGPLLNAGGQVVGINTAIIDGAQNIGFAIAIDALKPLIDDLKEGKGDITPDSPFLGVSTQTLADVTDAVLERYGVTADEGAFVSDVVPGTGADDAGLQPGDVITAIDGQAVTSSADVGAIIRTLEAGDTITIEIERQGERQTITATVKSRSETGN